MWSSLRSPFRPRHSAMSLVICRGLHHNIWPWSSAMCHVISRRLKSSKQKLVSKWRDCWAKWMLRQNNEYRLPIIREIKGYPTGEVWCPQPLIWERLEYLNRVGGWVYIVYWASKTLFFWTWRNLTNGNAAYCKAEVTSEMWSDWI